MSGRSTPPSVEERHNVAILRCFFLDHIKELNQLFSCLMVLWRNITGIICIGLSNLGRMFIFRSATRPNQEIVRVFHLSRSSFIRSNIGGKFALYNWSKEGVIRIPK